MELNRRGFLKGLGAALVGLGLGAVLPFVKEEKALPASTFTNTAAADIHTGDLLFLNAKGQAEPLTWETLSAARDKIMADMWPEPSMVVVSPAQYRSLRDYFNG